MHRRTYFIIVIVLFIAVVVLLSAIIAIIRKEDQAVNELQTKLQQTTKLLTPTPTPIFDTKHVGNKTIYTDKTLFGGMSFTYPVGWRVVSFLDPKTGQALGIYHESDEKTLRNLSLPNREKLMMVIKRSERTEPTVYNLLQNVIPYSVPYNTGFAFLRLHLWKHYGRNQYDAMYTDYVLTVQNKQIPVRDTYLFKESGELFEITSGEYLSIDKSVYDTIVTSFKFLTKQNGKKKS